MCSITGWFTIGPTTGTLAVQFTFPNPERLVRPGQYGRVRGVNEVKKGALLVPQRAVAELQNLYSVAVVGEGDKVAFRNVKVGPRVDGLWVIEEGLKPGEKVVVEGLQKVREGMVVSPKAAAAAPAGKGAAEPAGEPRPVDVESALGRLRTAEQAAAQKFIQSDVFDQMMKDKDVRSLLSDKESSAWLASEEATAPAREHRSPGHRK